MLSFLVLEHLPILFFHLILKQMTLEDSQWLTMALSMPSKVFLEHESLHPQDNMQKPLLGWFQGVLSLDSKCSINCGQQHWEVQKLFHIHQTHSLKSVYISTISLHKCASLHGRFGSPCQRVLLQTLPNTCNRCQIIPFYFHSLCLCTQCPSTFPANQDNLAFCQDTCVKYSWVIDENCGPKIF